MGNEELEKYIMDGRDRPNKPLVWPCCKEPLPAPLDGVASVRCGCGCVFTPEVIHEFNALLEIATQKELEGG